MTLGIPLSQFNINESDCVLSLSSLTSPAWILDSSMTSMLWVNNAGLHFWGINTIDELRANDGDFLSSLELVRRSEWQNFLGPLTHNDKATITRSPNGANQESATVTTVRVEHHQDSPGTTFVAFQVLSTDSRSDSDTSYEASALNNTDTLIALYDSNDALRYRNAAALAALPESSTALLDLFYEPTNATELFHNLQTHGHIQVEQELLTRHGPCWFSLNIKHIATNDKTDYRILVTANNSSRWHLAAQKAHELAQKDSLTALPNRASMSAFLKKITKTNTQDQQPAQFGLFFLDLDRFKIVNDSLGHSAGDELLIEVARRLRNAVSDCGNVYRLGGDEFVVIFDGLVDEQGLETQALTIFEHMVEPAQIAGHNLRIRPSIGICTYPEDGSSITDVLQNADAAMYLAKAERSGYCFFDAQMTESHAEISKNRLSMENDLITALENGQFEVYYQPKIACNDLSIAGVEALLRWNHPERGMVSPDDFIQVAEESGHIVAIGRWVLETAMQQQRLWQNLGFKIPVSINISARQFHNGDLIDHVSEAMSKTGCDPEMIELEITESMLLGDTDQIQDTLQQLSRMGIMLALDDFGTGFSNLAYLQKYPLDVLKIDRIFLADQKRSMLMGTILNMGKVLGLTVVAEGVENSVQADWLIARGCDQLQGYYFSKPLPVDDTTQYLMDNKSGRLDDERSAA